MKSFAYDRQEDALVALLEAAEKRAQHIKDAQPGPYAKSLAQDVVKLLGSAELLARDIANRPEN